MLRILIISMIFVCLCLLNAWANVAFAQASSIEVFVAGDKYSSIGEYKQMQKEAILNKSLDVVGQIKNEALDVENSIIDQAVKDKEVTVVNGKAHQDQKENQLSDMREMLNALKKRNQKYDSIVIDESKMKTIIIP